MSMSKSSPSSSTTEGEGGGIPAVVVTPPLPRLVGEEEDASPSSGVAMAPPPRRAAAASAPTIVPERPPRRTRDRRRRRSSASVVAIAIGDGDDDDGDDDDDDDDDDDGEEEDDWDRDRRRRRRRALLIASIACLLAAVVAAFRPPWRDENVGDGDGGAPTTMRAVVDRRRGRRRLAGRSMPDPSDVLERVPDPTYVSVMARDNIEASSSPPPNSHECGRRSPPNDGIAPSIVVPPPTYLATYPGSGSRSARRLVRDLSYNVYRVQDETETGPASDAIVVQTRYPHRSGRLVDWDADVSGAIVLVRSPLRALPALFDELRAAERHLPARFQQRPAASPGGRDAMIASSSSSSSSSPAAAAEWTSWRDRMFTSQVEQYAEFVRYWAGRYAKPDRLILSYEELSGEWDDADGGGGGAGGGGTAAVGVEEARRLAVFLGRVVGGDFTAVPTVVDSADVACVWRGTFARDVGGGGDGGEVGGGAGGGRVRRRLDGYIIPHPSSVGSDPSTDRPFTVDQLRTMAAALLRLSEESYATSHYLNGVLGRYRAEIIDVMRRQTEESAVGVGVRDESPSQEGEGGEGEGEGEGEGGVGSSSFHVFHVSPPGTESPIVTNWLMGLFEPAADCATLTTSPGIAVYQDGSKVPIATTIVTRTNEMNLIGMYKIFKPSFDEVFFVLSRSGNAEADGLIDERVCDYDNVLCVGRDEQMFRNTEELRGMVRSMTERFKLRFYPKYFASLMDPIRLDEEGAVARLLEMNNAVKKMQIEAFDVVHPKFGIRGGGGLGTTEVTIDERKDAVKQRGDVANVVKTTAVQKSQRPPGRLFYCGSTGSGPNINFSTLGIYLANVFLPEITGSPPTNNQDDGTNDAAIQLTPNSLNQATPDDFLVSHLHQHCEVNVLEFPGKQLHINHPTHGFSAYGRYTPPAKNVFVIGAHEEGNNAIQLPYAMMRWWVLVKSMGSQLEADVPMMEKFFLPSARPKNTGKEFLLYVNSHYVAYREMSAHMLSRIGPIHALGSCQGNLNVVPVIVDASRPPRCQPYPDGERPPSIIVNDDMNGGRNNYFNKVMFQDFRFMLLMEDANIPGYITERIVDGFMAGTVPIYYGTTQIFDIFNPKAFVYFDINNPSEALDRIRHLEGNPDAYRQMLDEPILADGERTIEKYFSFDDSIGNGMLKKRVRKKLGFPIGSQ